MKLARKLVGVSLASGLAALVGASLQTEAVAAERLYFEGDMVRGVPKTGPTGPVCVMTSQFKRKEKVVWRIRVFDPAKPKQLGKAAIKSMVVELPDGKKFNMRFGTHPPKKSTDTYWTAAWDIPADYPTGSFGYKVVATDSKGRAHTWKPFSIGLSQFTVIAGDIKPMKMKK